MIIRQKRIRSLQRHLWSIQERHTAVFGVRVSQIAISTLAHIGFSVAPSFGDVMLPPASGGPVSLFNSEGKYDVHKDQPMETAYRQADWNWTEWHGRYDRVEQSKIVDVPYKRYPRTFVPPPSIEVTIGQIAGDDLAVVSPPIQLTDEDTTVHVANLFLEIFGEVEVFTENLEQIIQSPLRRLNWRILPPGERPWPQLRNEVDEILRDLGEGKRKVIEYRLETINSYGPDFWAIGHAGFRGYLVFGFPARNTYVLESIYFGNATYVFAEDWEALSTRTKAEILDARLQQDRVIHREGWRTRIHQLLTA